MVRRHGQLVRFRAEAGQHRRRRPPGDRIHRRRVPVPRPVPGERRDGRIRARFDPAVARDDRRERKLIEEDEHDRRGMGRTDVGDRDQVRPEDRPERGPQQKDRREEDRARPDERGERAHAGNARVEDGDRRAGRRGEPERDERAGVARALDELQREGGREHAHSAGHDRLRGTPADERGDGGRRQADERQDQHESRREQPELEGRGAVRGEELGIAREDVEQRLRDGDRRRARQVQPGRRHRADAPRRRAIGHGASRGTSRGGRPGAAASRESSSAPRADARTIRACTRRIDRPCS